MPKVRDKGRAVRRAAAVLLAGPAVLVPVLVQQASAAPAPQGLLHRNIPVCGTPAAGSAACDLVLHQVVTRDGKPGPNASSPSGYAPGDLIAAYNWGSVATPSADAGAGETIALVDAYDDPNAASDLTTFSNQFGLPTSSTISCPFSFTKVSQSGTSSYPSKNSGWALEESLDIEWAHAIAPCARILLVEASSASMTNLLSAEDYASSNAQYVSNSWGGSETSGETSYDSHFVHSGVSYFASAGDTGGVVEYPSASPDVISAGGTTLTNSGTSWSETAWSSGGGGCSAYEPQNPAQQTQVEGQTAPACGAYPGGGYYRATPDISSDANPNTGVAVYDSTPYYGQSGWFEVGGTSAASPVLAARAADSKAVVGASYVYSDAATSYPTTTNIDYWDVTAGSNGYPATTGYDLATGLGSWSGSGSATTTSGPNAPTNLQVAGNVTYDSVPLIWTASTSTNVTYSVYRSTTSGGELSTTPIVTGLSTTTYTDTSPVAGKTDYYEVVAVDSTGAHSLASNELSVSVPSAPGSSSTLTVTLSAGTATKKGPNYHVPIGVTVADSSSGQGVSGASVTLDVYTGPCGTSQPTSGAVASGSGTTGASGTVSFTFTTRVATTYCAWADASASGYPSPASGSVTFSS